MSNAGFSVSTDPDRLDIEMIHRFISSSYWAAGIDLETVRRSVEHSLCFGVYSPEGIQVGFARMITDRATFAYLADVFVDEAYRGRGLSHLLMTHIMAHPQMQGLRRILLATRDAHDIYSRYGFERVIDPTPLMQVYRPDVYQKNLPAA